MSMTPEERDRMNAIVKQVIGDFSKFVQTPEAEALVEQYKRGVLFGPNIGPDWYESMSKKPE